MRQACRVIPATSTTQSTAKTASSRARSRAGIRRLAVTQVIVASVTPKERPNVVGFRHESGPRHGRSSSAKTPRWTRPDTTSAAATAYSQRSRAPGRHRETTDERHGASAFRSLM